MGHAADQELFTLLQEDVTELIALLKKSEAVQLPGQEIRVATLNLEKENRQILEKLVSIEELLSVKLQGMKKDLTETSNKVKELEQKSIQMKKEMTCLSNRQGKKHQVFALDLVFVFVRSNSSLPGVQRSYFFRKKCCVFAKTRKPVLKIVSATFLLGIHVEISN